MGRPRKQANSRHVGGTRAVVYIRVSTDEQKKGFGPESQRDACTAYLAKCGYSLIKTTDDLGKSGAKEIEKRDGLREAVRLCEADEADVIVAYTQDRFSRSTSVWEVLLGKAQAGKWRLETARDGLDLTTEDNEMSADMNAIFAAWERKLIARRLRGGRRQRAKHDGRGSAAVPFGYRVDGGGVKIDARAAKAVRRLFALRESGKTYWETAAALDAEKIVAPRGGKWTPGQVTPIEKRRALYATGKRVWGGIEAAHLWPIVLKDGDE